MIRDINIQQLREQIAALQDATMDGNRNFRSDYDEGKFDALTAIDNVLDSLQEEPVSNDLEKAAADYEEEKWKAGHPEDTYNSSDIIKAVKYGAQWQKKQLMAKAVETTFNVSLPSGLYDALWINGCKDWDKLLIIKKDEL